MRTYIEWLINMFCFICIVVIACTSVLTATNTSRIAGHLNNIEQMISVSVTYGD